MKIESLDSARLGITMDVQCQYMTVENYLLLKDDIDKQDDERRIRSFNADKWLKDMMKSFIRNLNKAIKTKEWCIVEETTRKIEAFDKDYSKVRRILQKEELHFEEIDDQLRKWLISYIRECIEKIKDRSSVIDLRIIADNLEKKRVKWKQSQTQNY